MARLNVVTFQAGPGPGGQEEFGIWYPPNRYNSSKGSDLVFYSISEDKLPKSNTQLRKQANSSPPFWENPGWNDSGQVTENRHHIRPELVPSSSNIGTLAFWTDTASADIFWRDCD